MLDEEDMQRRELSRLLSTAKSKDRKELIKTALNKLDNNIGGNEDRFDYDSHTLNTTLSTGNLSHSSLFAPVHSELAINTTTNSSPLSYKQQMMRPMSARRRPSTPSLLDAIPENQTVSNKSSEKHGTTESASEIFLPPEDVADVVVSSGYDPRFLLPKFCFFRTSSVTSPSPSSPSSSSSSSSSKHFNSMNSANNGSTIPGKEKDILKRSEGVSVTRNGSVTRSYWMSTGLLPQFMKIAFCDTWIVRRVEIHCHGIEVMHVYVLPSSSFSSLGGRAAGQMIRISEDYFVFDFGEEQPRPQQPSEKEFGGTTRPNSRSPGSGIRSPPGSGGTPPMMRNGSSNGLHSGPSGGGGGATFPNPGKDTVWSGVTGKGLLIVVQQTSELFFGLLDVKVRVFPYT